MLAKSTDIHPCVAILPNHPEGPKTAKSAYPEDLKTIGDHLRKRRLDLGLLQKDVGRLVGVDTTTITNWEKNRTKPTFRLMPAVLRFLGCSPLLETGPLGERIRAYRRKTGTTQKRLAAFLGVDPTTLARWEHGDSQPDGIRRLRLNQLLQADDLSS